MTVFVFALLILPGVAFGQANATLQGQVTDSSGGGVPGAQVSAQQRGTGLERTALTDRSGLYSVASLPPGVYVIKATAPGFSSKIVDDLLLEAGRTLVRDFQLAVSDRVEAVTVRAAAAPTDLATSVGHVVSPAAVRTLPLNGQRFLDLALLVPGSVAPSQAGFSTTPIRGRGALAINSGGHREEAVSWIINGISTNNLTFGSLTLQPPLASLQEFRVANSTFSAEFGHVSGAVVSLVTRSGTDRWQGGVYEWLRDDALDAPNFFEASSQPGLFERHQYGGWTGGPLIPAQTFLFVTYEGLRQRQGIDLNSLVLNDAQRAAVSEPAVRALLPLIPRANAFDADGTARFFGKGEASVDSHSWTMDLRQDLKRFGKLDVFVAALSLDGTEPSSQGNTLPGFGHVRRTDASVMTIGHTQVISPSVINELRLGRSHQDGRTDARAPLNPADFGITNGVDRPIGLPQLAVAGGLNFGGPAAYPQGRVDTLYVLNNVLSYGRGRHIVRMGGEYRLFMNDNVAEGTGQFNFPTIAAFMAGSANAFSITLGERRNYIRQRAAGVFVQDRIAVRDDLSMELGLRYEWHVTPTERDNEFVVFDARRVSLVRVGVNVQRIYQQNNKNFEPRLGLAWDPRRSGRLVVRAAYGLAIDQPGTSMVRDTAANPPFATPLTATGAIPLSNALAATRPAGLAPATVDPDFANSHVHSWNVNVQQQLGQGIAVMMGYFGARGHQLRISRNLNQPVDGVRPYPQLSADSPINAGAALGNITQVESSGFSRYRALWVAANRRLAAGLHFDVAYTWSLSRDTNSLNSSDFAVQDGYDIPNQFGLSDFDARHRVTIGIVYVLPFQHVLARGWHIAAVVQAQSGNPLNIVTSNSMLNGVPNTVRPDVIKPIRVLGSIDQWFDPASFQAVNRFGNLGRNAVIGPGFGNTDFSIVRTLSLRSRAAIQIRLELFNLFNQVNLGPPGSIVGSPTFGKISRTRLPTGEAGSSRQMQIGLQLRF